MTLVRRYKLNACTLSDTSVIEAIWDEESLIYDVIVKHLLTGVDTTWTANMVVDAQSYLSSSQSQVQPDVSSFQVYGVNGKNLEQCWQSKPNSYYGVLVHNFPNYLMMLGPSTLSAQSDIKTAIDIQSKYNAKVIALVWRENQRSPYALGISRAAQSAHGEQKSDDSSKTLNTNRKADWTSAWRSLRSGPSSPPALKQPIMSDFDIFVGEDTSVMGLTRTLSVQSTASGHSLVRSPSGHEYYVNKKGHQIHYNPLVSIPRVLSYRSN